MNRAPYMNWNFDFENNHGLLTVFFAALSWSINLLDIVALDKSVFEPLAHIAAICAASVSVCLGLVTLYEKFKSIKKKA